MRVIHTLASQASGKLAGVVAATNRGGQYIRSRTIPHNPRTAQQTRIRALMLNVSAFWQALSPASFRDEWNDLARAATPDLTGETLFTRGNMLLAQAGQNMFAGPPRYASAIFTAPPLAFIIVSQGTPALISIPILNPDDLWYAETKGTMNVYASPPQSDSRAARQHDFTYQGHTDQQTDGGNFLYEEPATFDAVKDQVVYVRIRTATAKAEASVEVEYRVVVTTP